MTIGKSKEGETLLVMVSGRVDTTTAPELEKEVKTELGDVSVLEMDLKETEYISSAGLRVLLEASKMMQLKGGSMRVKNVTAQVMDVFKVTGFDKILRIV